MKAFQLLSVALVALLISACGQNHEQLVGNWEQITNAEGDVIVDSNDAHFIDIGHMGDFEPSKISIATAGGFEFSCSFSNKVLTIKNAEGVVAYARVEKLSKLNMTISAVEIVNPTDGLSADLGQSLPGTYTRYVASASDLRDARESASSSASALESAKAEAKSATEARDKAVTDAKSAQEAAKAATDARDKAMADAQKAQADAQKAKQDADKAKADLAKAKEENDKFKADAEKALKEANEKVSAAEKKAADAQKAIDEANKKIADLEKKIKELEGGDDNNDGDDN